MRGQCIGLAVIIKFQDELIGVLAHTHQAKPTTLRWWQCRSGFATLTETFRCSQTALYNQKQAYFFGDLSKIMAISNVWDGVINPVLRVFWLSLMRMGIGSANTFAGSWLGLWGMTA